MTRAGRTAALLALLGLLLPVASHAASRYAPPDRSGPRLSVPSAKLRAALACTAGVADARRNPILLVPGTNLDPPPNYAWNYERAFSMLGWPYCALTLPYHTMGDIQVAGEYVVHALRTMARTAGRRVDVLGYSQGGMLPRWALRFWPGTRALVADLVGLDPSNHGTLDAQVSCQGQCPPAYWQQATGSRFLTALNSYAETWRGIDYTVVFSRTDEIVVPNLDATGSSSLHTGAGRIANIAVQEVCPNDLSEHLAMGTYDPVGYALAIDAFTHRGPASAARIARTTCAQAFQPGVDAATFPTDYAGFVAAIARASEESPQTSSEPPLKCYVFARGCRARHRATRRHARHRRRTPRFTG